MALPIKQQLISRSASNFPAGKLILGADGLIGITIHGTGDFRPGVDAQAEANYVCFNQEARDRQVAVHGFVDDHVFIQTLPFDNIGWHAGDGCENPATDWGCFESLGIEMCEASTVNFAQAQLNFAELIARIHLGDPVFDWGDGRTRGKVSIEQLKQHIWVSQQVPPHDCPYLIRHNGTWAVFMTQIDAAVARLQGTTPAPPAPTPVEGIKLPKGLTDSLLERLYGVVRAADGHRYSYNPEGSRSKRWLSHSLKSIPAGKPWTAGAWPNLEAVFVQGEGKGTKLLQYSDGWIDDGVTPIG